MTTRRQAIVLGVVGAPLAASRLPVATAAPITVSHRAVDAGAYGVSPQSSDNAAAIARASADAVAQGVELVLPAGSLRIGSTPLALTTRLMVAGMGMGATTIVMTGNGGGKPFYFVGDARNADPTKPSTDVHFRDLTIDAAEVTTRTSKPFFARFARRISWTRVHVKDAPFTGFGCDFLMDAQFTDCIAENCGRLAAIGDAGASGFGVGTGTYPVENVVLTGCTGRGNKNYGVFFEQQGEANRGAPYLSSGARVVGGYWANNGYGVGDSGVDGLLVVGNVIEDNIRDGIIVDQGTGGGIGVPGVRGIVSDNVIRRNGRSGVFLDYRFKARSSGNARYLIRGNAIQENGASGVQLSTDSAHISGVTIDGNDISSNANNGIQVVGISTGSWRDLAIEQNRLDGNGRDATSDYREGVRIDGDTNRVRICRNAIYDDALASNESVALRLARGRHVDALIVDNDLLGNGSGPVDVLMAEVSGMPVIRGNRGHNPRGPLEVSAPPASGTPFVNASGYDCEVIVICKTGFVTDIAVGGSGGTRASTGQSVPTRRALPARVHLPAGASILVTYSGRIEWTWIAN